MTNWELNKLARIQKRQIAELNCKVKKLELIVNSLFPKLSDIECSSLKKKELEQIIDVFISELKNSKT